MANPTFSFRKGPGPFTQIQQVKAAGIAVSPFNAIPQTASPNTQGVPQIVKSVSLTKRTLSSTTCQITVTFGRDPGDPYFTQANVYLKVGSGTPTLVTQGNGSPLSFTTTRTKTPATVIVTSEGHWGSTAISKSPVKTVSLV